MKKKKTTKKKNVKQCSVFCALQLKIVLIICQD